MGYDNGELKAVWEIEAELKRTDDRRDYECELAGINIGRAARFHDADYVDDRRERRAGASQSQRSSQREFASRLQMLLATNAAYATSYQNAFSALTDAENAADQALAKLEAARTKALGDVQQMLDSAARLPDGRRVFKDRHGQVWDEHGAQIGEEAGASIYWRGDEPTCESYAEKQDSAAKLDEAIQDIRRGQVDVLGKIREEMTDSEKPPSARQNEELEGHARKFEQGVQKTLEEQGLKETLTKTSAVVSGPVSGASVAIPKLP